MPLTGHVDDISRSVIEGWAIDTDSPDETISVSILVNRAHRGKNAGIFDAAGLELFGHHLLARLRRIRRHNLEIICHAARRGLGMWQGRPNA